MPRDLPIGNGSLFLCFDEHYQIREITYPYAGAENHTVGHPCRFGFYVDGQMSWINSRDWNLRLLYRKDSLITNVRGSSELHRLSFESDDGIDFYESLWVRDLRITNDGGVLREIRPFFSFDFHINGTEVGDTAAFNPVLKTLTHYKKTSTSPSIFFTRWTVRASSSMRPAGRSFPGRKGPGKMPKTGFSPGIRSPRVPWIPPSAVPFFFRPEKPCSFLSGWWSAIPGTMPKE